MEVYGGKVVVPDPVAGVHFFFFSVPQQKKQYLVVSGSGWESAADLRQQLANARSSSTPFFSSPASSRSTPTSSPTSTRSTQSPSDDLDQRYRLSEAAAHIRSLARRHLRKDHALLVAGHSLGGSVGVLVAGLLMGDRYKVAAVYTFGQPKTAARIHLDRLCRLPVVRVVAAADPAPRLFPGALHHHGRRLLLLASAHYCFESSPAHEPLLTEDVFADDSRLAYHHIDFYARLIRAKLSAASPVLYRGRWWWCPLVFCVGWWVLCVLCCDGGVCVCVCVVWCVCCFSILDIYNGGVWRYYLMYTHDYVVPFPSL
jgi:pimeloyl-ACP methyl ester carboxylesterase